MASDELLEYSVIYTDRAKNLMAGSFSQAFTDISNELNAVYQADHCVMIPGSGTYAMEAVAGQFARFKTEPNYKPCMVIRNGFFSFRWSEIWDFVYPSACGRSPELIVVKANVNNERYPEADRPAIGAPDLAATLAQIREAKPCVLFMPHVETSAGLLISDEYIKAVAAAVHEGDEDAIVVLDCIASGDLWAKMKDLGVDVVITAPQKGWTSPACVGIAMMTARAKDIMTKQNANGPRGHSFSCNLAKWSMVADKYAAPGGFAYHTTLPTDSLMVFRDTINETKAIGFEDLEARTQELGDRIRNVLEKHGFRSVADEGFKAPTVVVAYMRGEQDAGIAGKFKQHGIQIAGGVPLKVDEGWPSPPPTFRIGLFGLDKLMDIDKCVSTFEDALAKIVADSNL